MKIFTSKTQKIGEIGENVTCDYLRKRSFYILDRNFTQKWGEIDIIAFKNGVVHFVEVKSVTHENSSIRAEDEMHQMKQRRLSRTIELYVNQKEIRNWQIDLACVTLDMANRKARVKIMEDIIL